jgi:hypothetical protein
MENIKDEAATRSAKGKIFHMLIFKSVTPATGSGRQSIIFLMFIHGYH